MIKTNIHTHTVYSDGKSTPLETVQCALEKGFSGLGFSDHGYTAFDMSYCMRDIKAYKDKIRALKDAYKNEIDIFLGVERDFFSTENTGDYDFVIGALHYIYAKGQYFSVDHSKQSLARCRDEGFGGNAMDMVKAYYDKIAESAIKTKPDVLGHFDVITKVDLVDTQCDTYRAVAREALDAVLDAGIIIEVNTGAMSRGYKNFPYPATEHLKRILERGGRIMLGSDCHEGKNIDFAFDFTEKLLSDMGFSTCTVLTKQGFCEVAI